MPDQAHFWSQAASFYEKEFVDPYDPAVRDNPIKGVLRKIADPAQKIALDLGCGLGQLLPLLSQRFRTVYAVDFAEGMLERARDTVRDRPNVTFVRASFADLRQIPEPVDVAVAVNSLVMPDLTDLDAALVEIARSVKPGGYLLGILPAIDAVHYYTMLLFDRARRAGMTIDAARKNAAHHAEHAGYDFAFGQFRFRGLEQHFWQPFEIAYRLRHAGFAVKRIRKVHLSWKHFAQWQDLQAHPSPWDWFFLAKRRSAILPSPPVLRRRGAGGEGE